jgi:tetratricopeptide (TPR) repeat protein
VQESITMAKKKRGPGRQRSRTLPGKLANQLGEVGELLRRQRWVEARDRLEALDKRFPNQRDVVFGLVEVYQRLQDFRQLEVACERLSKLMPNDAEVALALGKAHLRNYHPALAWRAFQRVRDRWPNRPEGEEARQLVADLETKLPAIFQEFGLTGDDSLEVAALHEEVQVLLELGRFPQARQVADQILSRRPNFVAALNNMSLAYFHEGLYDQAVATAQRVLAIEPDNFQALGNLTRFYCLSGRVEEARAWAARLKAVKTEASDVWIKRAEALSYLGDDQGVLDAFHGAEQAGLKEANPNQAYLYHLAAVAAYRLGRENEAHRYWKKTLKLLPGFSLAQANLDDLRQPVGQRHAPWPYSFGNWVRRQAIEDLGAYLQPAARRRSDASVTQATRQYLQGHPELVPLVPMLLDRGDPQGREFAFRLALIAETPELQAALKDFALGQRGPDKLRLEAANVLSQAGLLPSGPVRLWLEGEWREMLLMGFELHGEPVQAHSARVQELARQGFDALYREDGVAAERLLQQALQLEPESPDLLNNLANAYMLQDRIDEGEALNRDIHRRFPDYLFGRTQMARQAIRDGKPKEAKALLEPLHARRRLHFSEFAALCVAHIEMLLAEGNREGARTWLDLLERGYPTYPQLAAVRRQVEHRGWFF